MTANHNNASFQIPYSYSSTSACSNGAVANCRGRGGFRRNSIRYPDITLTLHRLRNKNSCSSPVTLSICEPEIPLEPVDIQSFLLYSLFGPNRSFKPVWCKINRRPLVSQICFVHIDGLSKQNVERHKQTCLRFLMSMTSILASCHSDIIGTLLTVPLTSFQIAGISSANDPNASIHNSSSCSSGMSSSDDVLTPPPSKRSKVENVSCSSSANEMSRVDLVLTQVEMLKANYMLPCKVDDEFEYSKGSYLPLSSTSPIFALDCEMCLTQEGHELTRISIVDEKLRIVLDLLVKPDNPIQDYLTQFSGITPSMMANVSTKLCQVQRLLREILPQDAILAGHSLSGDLKALHLYHPYIIDLAEVYNLSGSTDLRSGLKTLTRMFCGITIQNDKNGHCSIEDAVAAMLLTKLKLANGLHFGNTCYGWKVDEYLAELKTADPTAASIKFDMRTVNPDGAINGNVSPQNGSCEQCEAPLRSLCVEVKSFCSCYSLSILNCIECLFKKISNTSEIIGLSPPSKSDADGVNGMPCFQAFNVTSEGRFENAFDFFDRNKKTLFWVSDNFHSPAESSICQNAPPKYHIHETSTAGKIERLRERMLENDLNMVHLTISDPNSCADLLTLDTQLKSLYQSLASNSIFCVLTQDCSVNSSSGLFFYNIKR